MEKYLKKPIVSAGIRVTTSDYDFVDQYTKKGTYRKYYISKVDDIIRNVLNVYAM